MKRLFASFALLVVVFMFVVPLQSALADHTPDHYHRGRWIEVDITAQRVYLWIDEELQDEFVVSTGKSSTPTPIGEFFVDYQRGSLKMKGKPVRLATFITKRNIAFHNTEWDLSLKLGKPASSGCIRMYTEDAQTLYDFVKVSKYVNGVFKPGTRVCIHK